MISSSSQNDSVQITPSLSEVEEILGREAPKNRKEAQSIVGSINQLAAWCLNVKRNMPLLRKLTGASQFEWTTSHELEFVEVKRHLEDFIKLSPFDINLGVHIHTDASPDGLGYVISQPLEEPREEEDLYRTVRKFVTCGSCGLTETQSGNSTIELEALGILYACVKGRH